MLSVDCRGERGEDIGVTHSRNDGGWTRVVWGGVGTEWTYFEGRSSGKCGWLEGGMFERDKPMRPLQFWPG